LFLRGRIKEFINRGGAKISPYEIEDVLNNHPLIDQAVVFPIPHAQLGEDIAAAIILHEGAILTKKEIRRHAAEYLADFKVPRQIVFLKEIPKTSLGKISRPKLAEMLGITGNEQDAETEYIAPRTPLEQQIAATWAEVLKQPMHEISMNSHFLDLGGDSLAAMRLISRINKVIQVEITLLDLFDAPTVAEQAIVIEKLSNNQDELR
jgi:oxalate---CoA ligase